MPHVLGSPLGTLIVLLKVITAVTAEGSHAGTMGTDEGGAGADGSPPTAGSQPHPNKRLCKYLGTD